MQECSVYSFWSSLACRVSPALGSALASLGSCFRNDPLLDDLLEDRWVDGSSVDLMFSPLQCALKYLSSPYPIGSLVADGLSDVKMLFLFICLSVSQGKGFICQSHHSHGGEQDVCNQHKGEILLTSDVHIRES